MIEKIREAADFLKSKVEVKPVLGIVLGTGLGNLAKEIDVQSEVAYEQIPHFPLSTVESHSGKLVFGTLEGVDVVAMVGRFHYYEGYSMEQVVFPIRVMKLLGITGLLVSNAAGALNLDFKKGDLMLIRDHINLFPSNPLIGRNLEELGTRFPDMSEPYSNHFAEIARAQAKAFGIDLKEGVYSVAQGPMLETPAEYRMLKTLGGDAVGMSTVPEVIAANHMGLPVMAVSVLTDECDPENLQPVNIDEIIEVAMKAEIKLTQLFKGVVGASKTLVK